MTLTSFTDPISASELNANFTDHLAALTSQVTGNAGKVWRVNFDAPGITNASAASALQQEFVANDDAWISCIGVDAYAGGSSSTTATLTLSCIGEDGADISNIYLEKKPAAAVTTSSTARATTRNTVTDAAVYKGFRYRLTWAITGAGAATGYSRLFGTLLMQQRRRRA